MRRARSRLACSWPYAVSKKPSSPAGSGTRTTSATWYRRLIVVQQSVQHLGRNRAANRGTARVYTCGNVAGRACLTSIRKPPVGSSSLPVGCVFLRELAAFRPLLACAAANQRGVDGIDTDQLRSAGSPARLGQLLVRLDEELPELSDHLRGASARAAERGDALLRTAKFELRQRVRETSFCMRRLTRRDST